MQIQAEANLSALMESTEDLIWSVDLDDRLVTFNGALQRHMEITFGIRPAVGMLARDLVPPERANLMPPLYEHARSEGALRVEFPLHNGRTLDLALSPVLVDGKVTGVSVFGKDITEQKTVEKALREAEEKYRNIFDGALEGMFQTSPKGEPLTVNPALAKMLGYESPTEYLSVVRNVAHDVWADPNERALYLRQVKEHGTVLSFECQLKRKDGKNMWASLNTRRVCGADGELLYHEGFILDITERKRAEQEQREGLDTLRETQITGALGSYALDIPTGVWTSSEALDEFFGIGKEYERDVAGWEALIHPDDRAMMTAYFAEEVLGKRKAFDKEYRIVRPADGAEHWVHGMGRLEYDTQGQPRKMSGIIKDITERKRVEQALIESEKLFRAITETSPLAVALMSGTQEETEYMNPTFIRLFGYTRDDIPTAADWWPLAYPDPEYRQRVMEEWKNAVARAKETGSGIEPIELVVTCKDGSNKIIEWGLVNIGNRNLAYGVDITGRKQAEIQLRDSEERYRASFEQAAVGIVHASFEGQILRCNARFAEIAGYPQEEIPGMTVEQLTAPDDIAESMRVLHQPPNGAAKTSRLEKRFVRKDGSLIWAKLTISIQRNSEGRALHFISFVEDINARKAAEERFAEAAEALRKSEECYRTVFDTSPNAIVVARLSDGVVIDANRTYLDAAGYERDQVIGHTTMGLGIWANPADRQRLIDSLLQNKECRDMDFQSIRRTGGPFWMRISASLIEIAGQKCIVAFAQDITDARAATERLTAATNAIRLSEERYRTVFKTCPDAVMISRMSDGIVLDVNQAFLDSAGFQRDEVLGRTVEELGIWVNDSERLNFIDALARGESLRDVEALSRRKNGETFWMRLSASRIEIEGEQCRLTFAREITEVKAGEERLAVAAEALLASEERYRTVFHTSLDCITISHLSDGRYIDVNQAFLDLIGIEPHEIVGRTSTELGIWAHAETRNEIVQLLSGNSTIRDFQTEFVKKNGENIWVLISASVIEIGGRSCIVSVVRDISGAKAAENTIHSLAFYDPLTGLPNRRLLFDRLQQALFSGVRGGHLKALLLIDLDNLKTLNDTLGHHTGDLLLQEVARRIASCAHAADTVGRLGGDEFVVILDDLSEVAEEAATQAKAAGEEILASISQPCMLENREYHAAASLGVTAFGDRERSADDILQQADIALHLAKADGRNTLRFFSPALQAVVNAHATLEKDLRLAIRKNQFLLYYQPQVERGRMIGAEALIRWNHPSRGIVPPNDFIPMAEETRLILPLGDWVLETACRQIACWAQRNETAHLTLSVNISALQFRQPEFVDHVLAALDRTGAHPENLKLELTESMLVENFEDVIAKMTELKAHGLSLSLDDFGTGYSSLAYLKRLPLDQLKIDRTFVRDMMVDLTSGAIAQTIISLGRAMDLSVLAEGVETEEQRGFLAGLGCHSFQGYLFSRPLPLEEFEALL